MNEVLYFKRDNFRRELSDYLKQHSAWYVTAMCPVTESGWTEGIYVTVRQEG